ncbi:MAG: hypothetical protein K0R15_277 [Clostridiales bacterium]|jgi:2'-5' RNA ligase|nr:hypothetical protein [Clostridiales bacterium]
MRLFIAINFSDEIKNSIYSVIRELKVLSIKGNFVEYHNLHLTLSFLGELPSADLVKKAMNMAVKTANQGEFTITVKGLSKFRRREGDILFANIEENESLYHLQKCLTKELEACGFQVEDREYKPHLTLARKTVMQETFKLEQYEMQMQAVQQKVTKICLMKSERIKGELMYTEVYEEELV